MMAYPYDGKRIILALQIDQSRVGDRKWPRLDYKSRYPLRPNRVPPPPTIPDTVKNPP